MKYLSIFLLLLFSAATFAQPKKKWKQLFNGKDLKDWTVKISGHEVNENFDISFINYLTPIISSRWNTGSPVNKLPVVRDGLIETVES